MASTTARVTRRSPAAFSPIKPVLNFGFRFLTGYTLETSLDPYLGGRHHWYIVFRVTPVSSLGQDSGAPVYFLDSIDLPAPRQTGFIVENTGVFQTSGVDCGCASHRW